MPGPATLPPSVLPTRTPLLDVLREAGPSLALLGLAGRLPNAMLPLGLLLHLTDRTGSFAAGGLAVAALSVGGAVGGPAVGAAADRFGHRAVGLVVALGGGLALLGLVAVSLRSESLLALMSVAAVVGLGNPQVGALARSRWSELVPAGHDRSSFSTTAMGWEGAVDEASFVLGPVLVSALAAAVSPTAGLLAALLVAAVAQTGFALHPSALPARTRAVTPPPVAGRPISAPATLAPLVMATGAVGLVFGASQTGIVARLAESGQSSLTGAVYAALGVGAGLAGLLMTRVPLRWGFPARIAVGGALLVLSGPVVAAGSGPVALGTACLLVGVALAPILVSAYTIADGTAAPGRGATTMTVLATATVVGVAAGAALAGVLVDLASSTAAFAVLPLAGVVAACAGRVCHTRARTRPQASLPAPSPGCAMSRPGSGRPASAKAALTVRTTSATAPWSTSASADPPKPPPVMRAPRAPAADAEATARSSSLELTS
jgi:hypothetical protein